MADEVIDSLVLQARYDTAGLERSAREVAGVVTRTATAVNQAASASLKSVVPMCGSPRPRRSPPGWPDDAARPAVPPHAAVAVCGSQRTQSAMTSPLAMPLFWLVYRALKPMMLTI